MADAHRQTIGPGFATANPDNPNVDHESSDVDVRAILGFGAGLIVAAVLIHLVVWLLFLYLSGVATTRDAADFPLAAGQAARVPPEPRLQTTPREDLRALQAREEEILASYGWVDRTAGVVRIPIDDAIKLTLQRGLPSRAAAGGARK
ncbi:MAG: hypothetical protein ABI868_26335 [Acidobacteriota bacterium]